MKYLLGSIIMLMICFGLWLVQPQQVQAQPRITNTPISVVIPTIAPTETPQASNNRDNNDQITPSPTFTPPPALPDARLVSVAATGTAIIRDFPENGANVGVLQDNETYQVLGQYFSWYQIQVPSLPQGEGWVYFEDVQVSGNFADIPFVDPNVQPAQLSQQDMATATALVLFQTPSVAETATAESRVLEVPQDQSTGGDDDSPFLPTYTPPAEINSLQPITIGNNDSRGVSEQTFVESVTESVLSGEALPLIAIISLAVLGSLGLLISAIRR
ncbi:MAG: hypothetical protein ACFE0Q_04235 [Anaerolineae bacterium]